MRTHDKQMGVQDMVTKRQMTTTSVLTPAGDVDTFVTTEQRPSLYNIVPKKGTDSVMLHNLNFRENIGWKVSWSWLNVLILLGFNFVVFLLT